MPNNAESFADWSGEALAAYLMSEGYDIPPGTTEEELRIYVAELHSSEHNMEEEHGDEAEIIEHISIIRPARDDEIDAEPAHYSPPALQQQEGEAEKAEDDFDGALPVARHVSKRNFEDGSWVVNNELDDFADEARYDEGAGEAHMDNFAKPTLRAAEAYASLHHPRRMDGRKFSVCRLGLGRYCFRNGGPVSSGFDWLGEGTVSELTKYGTGLSLHFKNLKFLFWMFFFASIFSLPQLILNAQNTSNAGNGALFSSTLGNLFVSGDGDARSNQSLVFLCGNSQGYLCDYSIEGLSSLYAVTNLMIVLLLTVGILWIQYFIPKEQKIVTSLFLSVDLYSVWVPKIPPGCGEEALKQFFQAQTGVEVDDVNIAYDDGRLISLFIDRGLVLSELWRVTGRILLEFSTPAKATRLLSEEEMTLRKADRLERLVEFYDLLLTTYHSLNEQTRGFNKGGARAISAVITFSTREGVTKALALAPKDNMFQGYALRCKPAPPPSTIQWENIEYSTCNQLARQFAAAIVVCLAIFGSFAANLGANAYRTELSAADRNLNQTACQAFSNTTTATTTVAFMLPSNEACFEYWQARAPLFIFTMMATLVVALVNFLVGQITISLAQLEKHHSIIRLNTSVGLRLFLAYSINTCFVFIIVNVVLQGASDLDMTWYANVGTQILLMMMLNIVTPHLLVLFTFLARKYWQWFGDKPLLQREMNERSIGPNFPYAVRTAQIMMQSFICLVFGPGMPLLYAISTLSFLLFFIVDKACVLRFYRTPPEFDESISHLLVWVLWLALMGNLAFATWSYSVPGLFVPLEDLGFFQRISLPHTLPLLLMLIVVTSLFVLTSLVGLTLSCRQCLGKKQREKRARARENKRSAKQRAAEQEKNELPPLQIAKNSGWLRGLKSYNILQNPKYRRAFGVPKSFCDEHSHVNSVVALPEGEGLPELPDAVRKWLSEY